MLDDINGMDALAQGWRGMNNFVNASFALIPKVIKLVRQQKAIVTPKVS